MRGLGVVCGGTVPGMVVPPALVVTSKTNKHSNEIQVNVSSLTLYLFESNKILSGFEHPVQKGFGNKPNIQQGTYVYADRPFKLSI